VNLEAAMQRIVVLWILCGACSGGDGGLKVRAGTYRLDWRCIGGDCSTSYGARQPECMVLSTTSADRWQIRLDNGADAHVASLVVARDQGRDFIDSGITWCLGHVADARRGPLRRVSETSGSLKAGVATAAGRVP
jgi:hypothetical protein